MKRYIFKKRLCWASKKSSPYMHGNVRRWKNYMLVEYIDGQKPKREKATISEFKKYSANPIAGYNKEARESFLDLMKKANS